MKYILENKIYLINDIMKVLPHRYPFLLLDKIEVIEQGAKGIGYKNVTINEPFFQGHFPNNPVMPGVLQIEAMAQAAGFIVATEDETLTAHHVLFMGVDKVKFRKQVLPGDTLEMHVTKLKQHKNIVVCETKAYVGGVLVCQAELTAMINRLSADILIMTDKIHHHLHHHVFFFRPALCNHQRECYKGVVRQSFAAIGTIENSFGSSTTMEFSIAQMAANDCRTIPS